MDLLGKLGFHKQTQPLQTEGAPPDVAQVQADPQVRMRTDRLASNCQPPAPLEVAPQLKELSRRVGAHVHERSYFTSQINDAEVHKDVAELTWEAGHVSSPAELDAVGSKIEALMDRINATPPGKLSQGARDFAGRNLVLFAEANQMSSLMTAAQHLMKSGTAEQKREAAALMQQEAPELQDRIHNMPAEAGVSQMLADEMAATMALVQALIQWMINQEAKHEDAERVHNDRIVADGIAADQTTARIAEQTRLGALSAESTQATEVSTAHTAATVEASSKTSAA